MRRRSPRTVTVCCEPSPVGRPRNQPAKAPGTAGQHDTWLNQRTHTTAQQRTTRPGLLPARSAAPLWSVCLGQRYGEPCSRRFRHLIALRRQVCDRRSEGRTRRGDGTAANQVGVVTDYRIDTNTWSQWMQAIGLSHETGRSHWELPVPGQHVHAAAALLGTWQSATATRQPLHGHVALLPSPLPLARCNPLFISSGHGSTPDRTW